MTITWLGCASICLESAGQKIYFDPFLRLDAAKHIFITHGHYDHMHYAPHIEGSNVYCTESPSKLVRNPVVISVGDLLRVESFEIRVLKGRHARFDLALVIGAALRIFTQPKKIPFFWRALSDYPEKGETVMFDVRADGKRVTIMGSMALDRDTWYEPGADCLVLPYQGYNDNLAAALPIVERLKPKMVVIDHFDDAFPPITREIEATSFLNAVPFALKPEKGVHMRI
ncbi:MAG: MBL fold metallo-hydrolase [Clostridiales bacterium]|jgi:L-ascorbate metabolism protein UlaG (beta-lactamase superfamily)|nr:MBL fold metallo-hydrolase [Clostridiales bacterium]